MTFTLQATRRIGLPKTNADGTAWQEVALTNECFNLISKGEVPLFKEDGTTPVVNKNGDQIMNPLVTGRFVDRDGGRQTFYSKGEGRFDLDLFVTNKRLPQDSEYSFGPKRMYMRVIDLDNSGLTQADSIAPFAEEY
jgi:hypothetical protein